MVSALFLSLLFIELPSPSFNRWCSYFLEKGLQVKSIYWFIVDEHSCDGCIFFFWDFYFLSSRFFPPCITLHLLLLFTAFPLLSQAVVFGGFICDVRWNILFLCWLILFTWCPFWVLSVSFLCNIVLVVWKLNKIWCDY
jgi:hypothetical protein